MTSFTHSTKKIIRENWCKILLKDINEAFGFKLVYLGLPGIEALDILSWIDYLDKIIAFQCRNYPEASNQSQPRTEVEKLDEKLRELERKGKIKSYSLYDGWIEEVVLRGRDTDGNSFSQGDVVTVYNLDFCNPLTVPLKIPDDQGNVTKYYKLDAICKLLEIQRDLEQIKGSKKFIMFLTVHSMFWKDEAEKLLKNMESESLKKYMKKIMDSRLEDSEKNIRLLKLYVFYTLKNHFCNRNFIPEFLPPIYYKGGGGHWLIHFTILGTYHTDPSASAPFFQNSNKFMISKFLLANEKNIILMKSHSIRELNLSSDPLKLFRNSKAFEIWGKN